MKSTVLKTAWKLWKAAMKNGKTHLISWSSCLKQAWRMVKEAGEIALNVICAYFGKWNDKVYGANNNASIYVDGNKIEISDKKLFETIYSKYIKIRVHLTK